MYLVGIFLLPFRIFVIISNLLVVYLFIKIACIGLKPNAGSYINLYAF